MALLVVASLSAPAASAQSTGPIELRFVGRGGVVRGARLADVAELGRCTPGGTPPSGTSAPVTVVLPNGQRGTIRMFTEERPVRFTGGRGSLLAPGVVCEASPQLLAALASARQVPGSRAPWAGLIVAAGLLLLILVLAAAGRGVGPEPALVNAEDAEPPVEDREHDA